MTITHSKRLFFCRGGLLKGILSPLRTEGAALILVLWVLVLLTAIAAEFAFSMRTEVNITRNFKEEQEAYYAALAGIEQAKAEIISAKEQMYLDEKGILILSDKKNPERKGSLGNVTYSYSIIDEDGKLNLNSATPEQLRYILKESGVDGTEADTIIDSILDWRDPDNLHRINGAEEYHYQSLPKPYSCKDGPFDTIDELLLVKGMVPEILYGSKKDKEQKYKGILRYITAKSSYMININTAEKTVLEALFGTAVAGNILMQRSGGPLLSPMAGGVAKSSYFAIVSTGKRANTVRTVKAIVRKKDNKTIETLYWNDNWTKGAEIK